MDFFFQTFGWSDAAMLVLPFVATILPLCVVVLYALLGEPLNQRMLLLFIVSLFFPLFSLLVSSLYIRARFSGAPASFEVVVTYADITGALFLICYIITLVLFPLVLISFKRFAKISSSVASHRARIWTRGWQYLIACIPTIVALYFASLFSQSKWLYTSLFGTAEAYECITNLGYITRSYESVAASSCPIRFSTLLSRAAKALGIDQTVSFNIVATLITIGAILQGAHAFLELYDRFFPRHSEVSREQRNELPPPNK
jgi:hypothetical protein